MIQHTQILPGVFLTAVQSDKFKTGCFSVNFLRPLRRSEAAMNTLLPAVLLRGSRAYPDIRQISRHLDNLYGASVGALGRKKGEVQLVGLYADFVEDDLVVEPVFAPMADFAAELLLRPRMEDGCFLPDVVESEKRNLENIITSRVNDKRSYVQTQLLRLMCAEEAYGLLRAGELEDVAPITPQALSAHYRDVLANSRVEIFYMGAKSPEEAAACFRSAFAELPRGEAEAVGTEVIGKASAVKYGELTMDVNQGKLAIGLRTGCTAADTDYPALLLLTALYGGCSTSKLFLQVREELSLCYYASAYIDKYKGVMIITSGVETDKLETAKEEILRQLELCKAGEISDYEFDSAKRYLLSELKMAQDSPGRLDDFYIGQLTAGLDGSFETLSKALQTVTKADCARAANRLTLDTVFFLKGGEEA